MLMWHITLMPIVVVVLTAWHVLMVRRRGVVPPFPAKESATAPEVAPAPEAVVA